MLRDNVTVLSDMSTESRCVIVKINGHGSFRRRIMEMGFVKGEIITVIKNAPLHDPIEYMVMGSHVSLRRSEASQIEVADVSEQEVAASASTFTESINIISVGVISSIRTYLPSPPFK